MADFLCRLLGYGKEPKLGDATPWRFEFELGREDEGDAVPRTRFGVRLSVSGSLESTRFRSVREDYPLKYFRAFIEQALAKRPLPAGGETIELRLATDTDDPSIAYRIPRIRLEEPFRLPGPKIGFKAL